MKKKVLIAASVASMIGQFNMSNIRLLQDMGYEVHVICNFQKGNTCDHKSITKLKQTLHKMQVPCFQWNCPRSVTDSAACIKAYLQIRKLIRKYRYCFIHCHSPIGGVLARFAAHREKIPVVYTAHGFHFYKGAPIQNWLLYYSVEKLLAHWTDVLITVNREDQWFAKRHLAAHIRYTPGIGIDTKRFWQMRPEKEAFRRMHGMPEDAAVLLSVGELNDGKNHRLVLDALAGLSRKDVYYMICGQGALYRKLQEHAKKLGISRYVRMVGYRDDLAYYYRNADIFVFPSRREGMPVALIEAMAAGLPCIASDIRGCHELIGPAGTGPKAGGMLVPPDSPQQLGAALNVLLADGRLRQACGEHNRKQAGHYDRAVVEKQMRRIYKEMERCMEYG